MIPEEVAEPLADATARLHALRALITRSRIIARTDCSLVVGAGPDSDRITAEGLEAARAADARFESARQMAADAADAVSDVLLILSDLFTPDPYIAVAPEDHGLAMEMATAYLDGVEHNDDFALLSAVIKGRLTAGHLSIRSLAGLLAAQARLVSSLALHHTPDVPSALAALRAAGYSQPQNL